MKKVKAKIFPLPSHLVVTKKHVRGRFLFSKNQKEPPTKKKYYFDPCRSIALIYILSHPVMSNNAYTVSTGSEHTNREQLIVIKIG